MTAQLGFGDLLAETDAANRRRREDREHAGALDTIEEAADRLRPIIRRHHDAMLAADVQAVERLRIEARTLLPRLNAEHRQRGDWSAPSPAQLIENATAPDDGSVPLWGQTGEHVVDVAGCRVLIERDGLLHFTAGTAFWLGFGASVVDAGRPFISPTGFRSFLGPRGDPAPGIAPEIFVTRLIEAYVSTELKGRLVPVEDRYHGR